MNWRKVWLPVRNAAERVFLALMLPLAALFAALFFVICRLCGVDLEDL